MKPITPIAPAPLAQQARDWTRHARQHADELRQKQKQAEELAAHVAQNPDLRRDAVARRQAGIRAAVGLAAAERLQGAADVVHRGSVELARRAMPKPSSDAGQAVRDRAEVAQMCAMPEHELAALLREDRRARHLFMANATGIELREIRKNPVLDVTQLEQQVLAEAAPDVAEAVAETQEAHRELLQICGRLVSTGIHGTPWQVDSVPSPGMGRAQIDHANRYRSLPSEWQADQDGVFIGDLNALQAIAEGAAEGAA